MHSFGFVTVKFCTQKGVPMSFSRRNKLNPAMRSMVAHITQRQHGLFLVTSGTGGGKSTVLSMVASELISKSGACAPEMLIMNEIRTTEDAAAAIQSSRDSLVLATVHLEALLSSERVGPSPLAGDIHAQLKDVLAGILVNVLDGPIGCRSQHSTYLSFDVHNAQSVSQSVAQAYVQIKNDLSNPGKVLTIFMNGHHPEATGYDDTMSLLQEGANNVVTYCLDFASFEYAEKGYRVRVVRTDPLTGAESVIDLAELLQNKRPYTMKEIRRPHDAARLIKSGAITFLPEFTLRAAYPDDHDFLESLSEEVRLSFQSWFIELEQEDRESSGPDYSGQPLRVSSGIQCWFGFFKDGLSPQDAIRADQFAE